MLHVSCGVRACIVVPNSHYVSYVAEDDMGWACGTYGQNRNAYRVFVRKHQGKRRTGRPRRTWKCNKIDLKETGWDGVDWINLV